MTNRKLMIEIPRPLAYINDVSYDNTHTHTDTHKDIISPSVDTS